MPRELDFFLSLVSTYTYLSVNRAEEVAAREGVSLRWRPFNVRAGEVENVRAVLVQLGKDPEATIARANSDEIRARLDAETDVARKLGIFGSPTFAFGTEIFWGDDRLEDAIDWAKTHG